ncbi:MAG: DUF4860 domain-containing protein [Clostridiales bacterium]|jgi:hypothetical protein|nr:DUF4860 domain-containing protein [Clostridiales bacterium]
MDFFDESGSGLTELIMVMTLMIFFGMSMYLIIFAGSGVTKKVNADKDAQIEARTALSYVNVRIRQFDMADSVSVTRNDYNGGDSLLLKNRDPLDPDLDYDTWIFWDNGVLMELLSDPYLSPQWGAAVSIARVDGFRIEQNYGFVTSYITYAYDGEEKTVSSSALLRSRNTGGRAA